LYSLNARLDTDHTVYRERYGVSHPLILKLLPAEGILQVTEGQ